MHAARRFELLHRFVPLLPGLFFGLSGSLGGRILDALPLLALRSRHEPDHLARARTHACVQWEMPSVRQYQFVETYFYLPFRGEVCVQRSDFALAGGDRLDFSDLAGHVRSDGHDKAVKRVYRPYDDCANRLAHIFCTRLLLQSYLQWCALGHREINGLERRGRLGKHGRRPQLARPAGGKLRNGNLLSLRRAQVSKGEQNSVKEEPYRHGIFPSQSRQDVLLPKFSDCKIYLYPLLVRIAKKVAASSWGTVVPSIFQSRIRRCSSPRCSANASLSM